MRKVEKYEIADGRVYDSAQEALDAEIIAAICSTVPCSVQVGENIKNKWPALAGLMLEYMQNKPKPEYNFPSMPHFG